MQKNNLCPISNKVLTYEDSFSQSTFDQNKLPFGPSKTKTKQIKQKFKTNISNKRNPIYNNNIYKNIHKKLHRINYNKINNKKDSNYDIFIEIKESFNSKYKKSFELNFYIFTINYIFNKSIIKINNNNEYISKFYRYDESSLIIPKKEFYFYHHMIFLERPNFTNTYFNQLKKNIGLKKLDIYQNQRKKEYKIEQISNAEIENELETKKIFDTNILETIENYSTTITQEPNNEKYTTLTPLEIFKRCEDTKNKKIIKNNKDQKSVITFSESEISYKSRNIADESMQSVINDLSEKKNKTKKFKQEKRYTNYYIKKKDIQKFGKNNKNNMHIYNQINSCNSFANNKNNKEEKEIINKKRISTSTNKKRKKINFDLIYQNTISKCSSKRASFINNVPLNKLEENIKTNFTSFGTSVRKKNKRVLNLKKAYNIKSHATKLSDNYLMKDNSSIINNINSTTLNSKNVTTSFNNKDKLFSYFFTPKAKNKNNNISKSKYEVFKFYNISKRQLKKNTTLNLVNNNIISKSNNKNSQEKFKNIKKTWNFKSKSPLTRLFIQKTEYSSNFKKSNIYKNKKSVLVCELEQCSQIEKSQNKFFFDKNRSYKKNMNSNKNIISNNIYNNQTINNNSKNLNIMTLNQKIGAIRRNSYQFMKLKKFDDNTNLLK